MKLSANAGLFLDRVASVSSPTGSTSVMSQSGQIRGLPRADRAFGSPSRSDWDYRHQVADDGSADRCTPRADRLGCHGLDRRPLVATTQHAPRLQQRSCRARPVRPYLRGRGIRGPVRLRRDMPWLIVAAHRGQREPTRWLWPAVFGLALGLGASSVNAAFLPSVDSSAGVLVLYKVVILRRPSSTAPGRCGWRATLAGLAASAWSSLPGPSFEFVVTAARSVVLEQADADLVDLDRGQSPFRLLGYWVFYFGIPDLRARRCRYGLDCRALPLRSCGHRRHLRRAHPSGLRTSSGIRNRRLHRSSTAFYAISRPFS